MKGGLDGLDLLVQVFSGDFIVRFVLEVGGVWEEECGGELVNAAEGGGVFGLPLFDPFDKEPLIGGVKPHGAETFRFARWKGESEKALIEVHVCLELDLVRGVAVFESGVGELSFEIDRGFDVLVEAVFAGMDTQY